MHLLIVIVIGLFMAIHWNAVLAWLGVACIFLAFCGPARRLLWLAVQAFVIGLFGALGVREVFGRSGPWIRR